jgi:hypothetical protein
MKTILFSLALLAAAPALAQQSIPDIPFDSTADFLKLPGGTNFGEVPGVAVNSKGHVFVFTRSNSAGGPAYAPTAAQLLEFGPKGEFIREIGKGLYGWSFAHSVRIDKDDNIWAIDKGARNPRMRKPSRGRTRTHRCRTSMACSASRPTSPGIQRETSTSRTATSTRASRNTTRTATG